MKIFCIGRNYVDHAKELNNKVPKQPLVFMKPPTALAQSTEIPYPSFTKNLHFELELTLRVSKPGKNVPVDQAMEYVDAIGLGIDYTARDVQARCKEKGHSWEIAKAFDNSAALSSFKDMTRFKDGNIEFELKVNGESRQKGSSSDMIFDFKYLIHHVSKFFTIEVGDYIMTGTPAGVGPVQVGDRLEGYLGAELMLQNSIISE